MNKIFTVISLFLSFSVYANIPTIVSEPEVEKHIEHMREKGFTLSNIKDLHATTGLVPRCICDNYEFTYSKFVSRRVLSSMQHKKFNVNTTGHGAQKVIRVHEAR